MKVASQNVGSAFNQKALDIKRAEEKLELESQAWEETVDKLEVKPTQPVLMLKQTPLVKHLVGAEFRELNVHPHVFDGIFPEAKRSSPNHNAHIEMTRDVLKQIPKALTDRRAS